VIPDLTLIVIYTTLTPETHTSIEAWRHRHPDTWVCRVGPIAADGPVPADWQCLPDQTSAVGVGQVALTAGTGAWLLIVQAEDVAEPAGWQRLAKVAPQLDPQTIYLTPLAVGDRFADVQPRLLHRTGQSEGGEPNPAAELGLLMALLPVWPLRREAAGGWSGMGAADPLSRALVQGGDLDTLPWPNPEQADLPFSLRLLIADHYRQRGDNHEARCWLEPAIESGPPAMRVSLGLVELAEDRAESALTHFSAAWREDSLVRWPGYYPRDVIDRHWLGLVIAEAYRRLGITWAAELFTRLAESGDRPRQEKTIIAALGEQAERNAWEGVCTVLSYHRQMPEQADTWQLAIADGGIEGDLARGEVWHLLESAGLKGNRARPIWQRVARQAPDDPRPWQRLGSVAAMAEKWPDAIAAFTEALARADVGWVWNSLGVAQVRLGQRVPAETSFRNALAAAQPDPAARRNLTELERMLVRNIQPPPPSRNTRGSHADPTPTRRT
jgi:tetratricopeptide (TPR) repeat protein